ncbi:jg18723 [Pararge aegeria aegeria]|uniref:Jg18723 protein n=1 Tax=Pararge aegeria aegeria TaxID=348720 RepID=A0A8S4RM93_9NEOP|nr:jg18723 [Pararge aegeria aegeria]
MIRHSDEKFTPSEGVVRRLVNELSLDSDHVIGESVNIRSSLNTKAIGESNQQIICGTRLQCPMEAFTTNFHTISRKKNLPMSQTRSHKHY